MVPLLCPLVSLGVAWYLLLYLYSSQCLLVHVYVFQRAWGLCTVSGIRSFEDQQLDQLDAKRQAREV